MIDALARRQSDVRNGGAVGLTLRDVNSASKTSMTFASSPFFLSQVSEYFDFQVNMIHTEGPLTSSPPSVFRTLSLSSTPYGLPSFHDAAGVHLLGA